MAFDPGDLEPLRSQRFTGTRARTDESALDRRARREFDGRADVAALFHENTKIAREPAVPGADRAIQAFVSEPHLRYATEAGPPRYRHHPTVELPDPDRPTESLAATLTGRRSRRSFDPRPVSLDTLSTVLAYGCGTTDRSTVYETQVPEPTAPDREAVRAERRSYPSPGGLYPTEPYVFLNRPPEGVERGCYHYDATDHSLRAVATDDPPATERLWNEGGVDYSDAAVWTFLVGAFQRVKAKYGPRGHQLALQESGHFAQNLLLMATATGLAAVPSAGFLADGVDEMVGADGVDRGVVYTVVLGRHDATDAVDTTDTAGAIDETGTTETTSETDGTDGTGETDGTGTPDETDATDETETTDATGGETDA
ncbi:MAG: SagB/ThcOx family dehydrogenase [Halobaculum sp.]